MAEQQHTQTHPIINTNLLSRRYEWRFMALARADMTAKPCRLSVQAESEHEARRILAPYFVLSLAARLPVQEVRHA